jgi:Zn ribbon nucleic-acid-binding protein
LTGWRLDELMQGGGQRGGAGCAKIVQLEVTQGRSAMKLAEGLRKHGFRKWYERELLQSHAHMALTFLCAIGAFAAIEAASQFRSAGEQLGNGLALLLCVGIGLWALRRYLFLLTHAEAVAQQADCPQCGTYGRLTLVRCDPADEAVDVSCRQCGHHWRIDD